MEFKKTVGRKYKFYGVHDTSFKIGPHVFEAIEDEDDGYRSYLQCINTTADHQLVFLRRSFATVEVREDKDGYFEGYFLVDVDTGHVWLRFGTDNVDNYYPMFIFEYKTPEQNVLETMLENKRNDLRGQVHWNPEVADLSMKINECIQTQEYDEAEDLIKKLKKVVDKQKKMH